MSRRTFFWASGSGWAPFRFLLRNVLTFFRFSIVRVQELLPLKVERLEFPGAFTSSFLCEQKTSSLFLYRLSVLFSP